MSPPRFPVFYDLCAELSFPRNPASSAAALNYVLNGLQVLFMAVLPVVPPEAVSALMVVVAAACLATILPVRATYARLDGDEAMRRREAGPPS